MSAITLRNESGGWEYATTTEDPYFAPILGSMLEWGAELPDTLVIPGALGEALEREWKYISLIDEWMQWENNAVQTMIPADYLMIYSVDLRRRIVSSYSTLPKRVLYRHDIRIIANSLNLPTGWEAYVAVDERTPLIDRVAHMQGSLDYLRAHTDHAALLFVYMNEDVLDVYRSVRDPAIADDPKLSKTLYVGSLAAPFFRNAWLTQVDKEHNTRALSIPSMLVRVDWFAAKELVTPYKSEDEYDNPSFLLFALSMTGEEVEEPYMSPENVLRLERTISPGILYENDENIEEDKNLGIVYSKILAQYPDDVDIATMGLEPILGDTKVIAWNPPGSFEDPSSNDISGVTLTHYIGWINAVAITYQAWLIDSPEYIHNPGRSKVPVIQKENFPRIVGLLGETVGLYAMRRILLSLLYYINRHPTAEQEKIVRANEFAILLEDYLSEHNGEDEDVRTLLLSTASTTALKKQIQKMRTRLASSSAKVVVAKKKPSRK